MTYELYASCSGSADVAKVVIYRNDQHRFKIVVDCEDEVDLMRSSSCVATFSLGIPIGTLIFILAIYLQLYILGLILEF
ncbi:hypothetical protein KSP40_PGU004364 [Platanthera guangdongensis]|uniref:AIR9 PH-like domain-containing protein n=1 Tax=Platanthera guangdongensis TaxID=2320717 RepID=A0ABR2MTT6_9ASPA